jgi:phage terminase Nu1 subunit (DNA packaging protein)
VAEAWLDKRKLADHCSCSVRTIETWMAAGMPRWTLGGRPKFRVSEVERWLLGAGYLRQVAGGTSVALDDERGGDATASRPRTHGGKP